MPTESAQMLCTVHRLLDGNPTKRRSKSGKTLRTYWEHPSLDTVLYKSVHEKHPCTVWTTETSENYNWHYQHFIALCDEYSFRYNRTHRCDELLRQLLLTAPTHIPVGLQTPWKLAMKDQPHLYALEPVSAYREFYKTKQHRFKMEWTKRKVPEWF